VALFVLALGWPTWGWAAPDSAWEKMADTSDGILAYRKEIPGSRLLAFRGEGVVDGPLPLVATILVDASQGPDWVYALTEARILRWLSPDEFIEYDRFEMPLIIADRELVNRGKITIDPQQRQFRLEYSAIEDPGAPLTRHVRGEIIASYILLRPLPDGKTHVEAYIHGDPKGLIPSWIVNFLEKDWPVRTFRGLRRQAAKKGLPVDPRFADLLGRGVPE